MNCFMICQPWRIQITIFMIHTNLQLLFVRPTIWTESKCMVLMHASSICFKMNSHIPSHVCLVQGRYGQFHFRGSDYKLFLKCWRILFAPLGYSLTCKHLWSRLFKSLLCPCANKPFAENSVGFPLDSFNMSSKLLVWGTCLQILQMQAKHLPHLTETCHFLYV